MPGNPRGNSVTCGNFRPPDKIGEIKFISLISQPKHVVATQNSKKLMRQFLKALKTHVFNSKTDG